MFHNLIFTDSNRKDGEKNRFVHIFCSGLPSLLLLLIEILVFFTIFNNIVFQFVVFT